MKKKHSYAFTFMKDVFKGLFLLIIIVYSTSTLFRTTKPKTLAPFDSEVENSADFKICARKEPYKLDPEFERVLSLIKQRDRVMHKQLFGNDNATDDWIYNCLFVEYGDVGESEGVFFFDDSVSSPDKLVINVNSSYKDVDDLLTALLLYHEMQHAGQYMLNKQYGSPSTCIDNEVMAFHWQYQFYRWLNEEEKKSLAGRVLYGDYSNTPIHAQIEMLEQLSVFSNNSQDYCAKKGKVGSWDCYVNRFVPQVRDWVEDSVFYQEQCREEM